MVGVGEIEYGREPYGPWPLDMPARIWYQERMDLPLKDLIEQLPRTNSPRTRLEVEVVGELSLEDVRAAEQSEYEHDTPLKKMRHRHHHAARLIAEGRTTQQVAIITGYTPGTISALKSDKAFNELVTMYKADIDELFLSMQDRMASLGLDMMDELQERLDEEPEKFTNKMLLETVKTVADRTGNGPSSTVNSNINIGIAERLKSARQRVIDITPEEVTNG